MNRTSINVQELAVKAALFDPLTAALLTLEEIRKMVNEMFEAKKEWLPQFHGK